MLNFTVIKSYTSTVCFSISLSNNNWMMEAPGYLLTVCSRVKSKDVNTSNKAEFSKEIDDILQHSMTSLFLPTKSMNFMEYTF